MTKVLDCTLRDGGNVNQWRFKREDIHMLLNQLDAARIDIIEVGYRGGSGSNRSANAGEAARCDDRFIAGLPRLRHSKYAVMVIPEVCELASIKQLQSDSIAWVRIAAYLHNAEAALRYIRSLKNSGFQVSFNLMAASYVTPEEMAAVAREAEQEGADLFYFADSFGALHPDQIEVLVKQLKAALAIPLGFHGHNNLGLSFANAVRALDCGVSYIDTSICGMARGAGNLPTEQFAAAMQVWNKYGVQCKLSPVLAASAYFQEQVLQEAMKITEPEIVCGVSNLHYYYYQHIERYCKEHGIDPLELGMNIARSKPAGVDPHIVEQAGRELSGNISQ